MREAMLDVDLTIPRRDVVMAGGFGQCMHSLMIRSRDEAVRKAAEQGGTVRPTVNPQVVVSEAISPLLGDVFLLATRWVVDVPDRAETTPER